MHVFWVHQEEPYQMGASTNHPFHLPKESCKSTIVQLEYVQGRIESDWSQEIRNKNRRPQLLRRACSLKVWVVEYQRVWCPCTLEARAVLVASPLWNVGKHDISSYIELIRKKSTLRHVIQYSFVPKCERQTKPQDLVHLGPFASQKHIEGDPFLQ